MKGGLGYIPYFLSENDQRPAKEQFVERYVGGWHPLRGSRRSGTRRSTSMRAPGS